jgi:hypothetical protein
MFLKLCLKSISAEEIISRKAAKAQRNPWKRGSALRLGAFAGEIVQKSTLRTKPV